jgi:hypothetical protein
LFQLIFSNPHRPFLLVAWCPGPAELRWAGPAVAFERPALTWLYFRPPGSSCREGAKVTYDIVPNKGKESAENLKVA